MGFPPPPLPMMLMMLTRFILPILLAAAVFGPAASPVWADLPIKVISVTSPVKPGGAARVEVQTVPAAVCAIQVVYRSGPRRAAPPRPRRADEKGRVVWVWRVGQQTPVGKAFVMVECLLGEDITKVRTEFTIR